MKSKELIYSFGKITILDNIMLTVINEGIIVDSEIINLLIELDSTYFKDKPFVYVSQRKNSYTIDPTIYLKASKSKNLIGFAVVLDNLSIMDHTEIEKLFLNSIPFEVFDNLDIALNWAKNLIKK